MDEPQPTLQPDARHMSWPTLNLNYDLLFDQDFPLIDRITGQPAAYILMKHLNQMANDENNNERATNRSCSALNMESSWLGKHARSGSLDLIHDLVTDDHCQSKSQSAATLNDYSCLSKSAQTLLLTDHKQQQLPLQSDFVPTLTLEINGLHGSDSERDSEHKSDVDSLHDLPAYALGPPDNCACDICLEEGSLHRRLCCDLAVCDSCLAAYYEHKLQLGQFSMECINSNCRAPAGRDEIRAMLSPKSRDIYRALLLANNDLGKLTRTCPQCNHLLRLKDSAQLKSMRSQRKKDQTASRVTCEQCGHLWCFLCHAPWHQQITCKQFQEGDRLLRNWAKQINQGQVNAQKCPTCKTFIQRSSGCDHMHCRNCQTDFCYQCGEKLRHLKFFGNHYSKLSVFGCKYRYKANQPVLRRTIRLSVFCAKLAAVPALCSAAVAAIGVAFAVGVVILPLYGLVRVGRWTIDKQHHKDDRSFAPSSNGNSNRKSNSADRNSDRIGIGCHSTGASSNGGARLLASARQLQRFTGSKGQAYPRLGRLAQIDLDRSHPLVSTTFESYAIKKGAPLDNNMSSSLQSASASSSASSSTSKQEFESAAKTEFNTQRSYYSYIDLSDRSAINPSISSTNKLTPSPMFTMDFDSLDRLEHWSLNRTIYGLGSQRSASSRQTDALTDPKVGSSSLDRRNKSQSGQTIKSNFILTSLF